MLKGLKKLFAMLLVLTLTVGMLGSCELLLALGASEIAIAGGEMINMTVGETVQLEVEANGPLLGEVKWESSNPFVQVSGDGLASANLIGTAVITVTYGDLCDTIVIIVSGGDAGGGTDGAGGDGTDDGDGADDGIGDGGDGGDDSGNDDSDDIIIPADKYKNMTYDEFYADYEPAVSYVDAMLRSAEGFMSGDITVPEAEPTLASYMPRSGGKYIRNSSAYFSDGGYTYTVVDGFGREVLKVYKGGGYITLEEVAAYVYAFGDIPANYDSNKNAKTVSKSSKSEWGEYLRLNNSAFSGSTTKYPYEPELPNISGCGGSFDYYEIDIGTTGTDTGNGYNASTYNNGTKITRGAARIVYVRYEYGRAITDPNDRYVFYTYNHYNDFQEYLNYFGGWGEMFGNITGGGTLSSKYDCNPTPYVEVEREEFATVSAYVVLLPFTKDEEIYA